MDAGRRLAQPLPPAAGHRHLLAEGEPREDQGEPAGGLAQAHGLPALGVALGVHADRDLVGAVPGEGEAALDVRRRLDRPAVAAHGHDRDRDGTAGVVLDDAGDAERRLRRSGGPRRTPAASKSRQGSHQSFSLARTPTCQARMGHNFGHARPARRRLHRYRRRRHLPEGRADRRDGEGPRAPPRADPQGQQRRDPRPAGGRGGDARGGRRSRGRGRRRAARHRGDDEGPRAQRAQRARPRRAQGRATSWRRAPAARRSRRTTPTPPRWPRRGWAPAAGRTTCCTSPSAPASEAGSCSTEGSGWAATDTRARSATSRCSRTESRAAAGRGAAWRRSRACPAGRAAPRRCSPPAALRPSPAARRSIRR